MTSCAVCGQSIGHYDLHGYLAMVSNSSLLSLRKMKTTVQWLCAACLCDMQDAVEHLSDSIKKPGHASRYAAGQGPEAAE